MKNDKQFFLIESLLEISTSLVNNLRQFLFRKKKHLNACNFQFLISVIPFWTHYKRISHFFTAYMCVGWFLSKQVQCMQPNINAVRMIVVTTLSSCSQVSQ